MDEPKSSSHKEDVEAVADGPVGICLERHSVTEFTRHGWVGHPVVVGLKGHQRDQAHGRTETEAVLSLPATGPGSLPPHMSSPQASRQPARLAAALRVVCAMRSCAVNWTVKWAR